MLRKALASSRYMILIAVVGSFAASVALMVTGGFMTVELARSAFSLLHGAEAGMKSLAYLCIELVDTFLLATVFYIISLGLYELFIDDRLALPHWLRIHDLDDLKEKLVGVLVVVLGVLFLGEALSWDGETNLLGYGAAIAMVIGALAIFIGHKAKEKERGAGNDAPPSPPGEG